MIDRLHDDEERPGWAVIDIGSNSVRLVMYEGPARSPITVFNEKTLCGLGQTDPETGHLRVEAVDDALQTLRRFRRILDASPPQVLSVFATAAARDAPNGQDFLAAVEEVGFSPLLLSGEEEARLAAYGIICGAPEILRKPGGVLAGDIGGGSLELSHITGASEDWVGDRISLPLGALRLSVAYETDRAAARKHIEKCVAEVDWLANFKGKELHIVGGAWRGLARIAMQQDDYPIDILDRYTIGRSQILKLCDVISRQSTDSLTLMPVVQRRRAPTLPYAAMVLEAVVRVADIDCVEVASSGVREGMLFAGLAREEQEADPLIEGCAYMAAPFGSELRPDAEVLTELVAPLFSEDKPDLLRWRHAAAILCNFSKALQPDERAIHSVKAIMALPLRGIDHKGRIYLSAALAIRHGARVEDLEAWLPMTLLNRRQREEVVVLGLALRFLATLSPGGGEVLETAAFVMTRGTLGFRLPEGYDDIWGATPAKRLDRLAAAMGLEPAGLL